MKILITGGSGFIGRNLIKSLKEDTIMYLLHQVRN
jgi:nucleoside-diphosphate-sugar epimerase